jgi:hypothetical protein
MENWKSMLKADPTDWLLEMDNPSVRYFALRDIADKNEKDFEVREAKAKIMDNGVVPKILATQKSEGNWGKIEDFYERSKYKGTVWQLIILAELGANGEDNRIRKTCEFILEHSQDRVSGGFSCLGNKSKGGQHSTTIPCLTGNMVRSLIKFGYLDDPRLVRGINWITTYQRFDDKIQTAPKGWPYDKWKNCWGKHTCHMGVVKALKALAEIPSNRRSEDVRNTIEQGVSYLLEHHIHKRSHNLNKISKPSWLQFGFPLMYQTDVLEILGILTSLGYKDNRMQESLDLVLSKQDEQGKWKLESTFNGRFQVDIEQKYKPSKWITLKALEVLKRMYN